MKHKRTGSAHTDAPLHHQPEGRCLVAQKDKNYGGRGISFNPEWNDFSVFLKDMGDRPINTTLGRIDNNGNYEKNNCRWETPKQQSNNTRRNILIEHDGKLLTIAQWSDSTGIKRGTIQKRYHLGKSSDQILKPVI